MVAEITIIVILIIFFSASVIAFIGGIRGREDKSGKNNKTLMLIIFISAVFSGYALIEFVKLIN